MGRKTRTKDPLAPEIGRRIGQAWRDAGFETLASFVHTTAIDPRLMSRYLAGEVMPGVRALMRIAEVCRVSLDWLILGREDTPSALTEWLQTPTGKAAPEEAVRFLRSLPIHGYRATVRFYDFAFMAWQHGLERRVSAEQVALSARTMAEKSGDG